MLIIGNIPDLFDHMPFVYGVDNKIILDKRVYDNIGHPQVTNFEIQNDYCALRHYDANFGWNKEVYYINGELYDSWKYQYRNDANPLYKYKFINFFFCGEVYLIAQKLILVEGHYDYVDEFYFVHNKIDSNEVYKIKAKDKILAFSKQHNIPYFFYIASGQFSRRSIPKEHTSNIYVYNKYIPLRFIKMYDIDGFKDVNFMYTEVYNYMMSLKNDDDCVEVSNKDKITQAGFDLKTSFRKM